MPTKYQAMFGDVKPVEIDKETDSSVWIGGRRRTKDSGWRPLFDTEREAWQHCIAESIGNVEAAEKSVAYRTEQHNNLLRRVPSEFK
jgi:hypothetical protein